MIPTSRRTLQMRWLHALRTRVIFHRPRSQLTPIPRYTNNLAGTKDRAEQTHLDMDAGQSEDPTRLAVCPYTKNGTNEDDGIGGDVDERCERCKSD